MEGKRGYAVMLAGGHVYQDRLGRFEFSYWRCLRMTLWPRSACWRGSIHHLPLRGHFIPGYIPPFHQKGVWE